MRTGSSAIALEAISNRNRVSSSRRMNERTRDAAGDGATTVELEATGEEHEPNELLELIMEARADREAAQPPEARPTKVDGVVVGRLAAVEGGNVVVHHAYAADAAGAAARAMVALAPEHV